MAGEKAKQNKSLVAKCAACDKELSVELLTGVVQGTGRGRFIAAVCKACLEKGWPEIPNEPAERKEPAEAAETGAPAGEASAAEPGEAVVPAAGSETG